MVDVGLAGDVVSPVPVFSQAPLRSLMPARDLRSPVGGRSALADVLARWQTGEDPAVSPFTSYLP
jgi:hypothetical protein